LNLLSLRNLPLLSPAPWAPVDVDGGHRVRPIIRRNVNPDAK
jgi:hypothetical protein